MKALFILGIVLLVLVLLSFVRLGAQVEYAASGVTVRVKTGPFLLTVFPRRGNGTKAGSARKKRKKNGAAAKEPAPTGGSVALVKKFLPLIAEAAGRMKRKIRIDVLRLDLTVAAADPAAAAMAFGGANAFLGMIWPLIEQNFNVQQRCIRTRVDFQAQRPTVVLFAQLTLSIGTALHMGIRLTVRFLRLFAEYKAEHKTGAAPLAKSDS